MKDFNGNEIGCEFCGCCLDKADRPLAPSFKVCGCPCHFASGRTPEEIDAWRRAAIKWHGTALKINQMMNDRMSPRGKPVRKHAAFGVDVWWCEDDTVEAQMTGDPAGPEGPEMFFACAYMMATIARSYRGGFEAGIEALTDWAMKARGASRR